MRHSVMIFVLKASQLIQLVDNIIAKVKIMTINELTIILVSGAFLKCFSIVIKLA